MLLILWPLAAFSGRSASTAIPFSGCCVLLALTVRSTRATSVKTRVLDSILIAIACFTVVQTLPLPSTVVGALSPHARTIRQALTLSPSAPAWLPLSIDESSTLWASAVTIGAMSLFVAARAVLAQGGLRQTVRGISAVGLVFSTIAIAQAATAGRSIYWSFPTEYEGPLPFGPFVNRNHFATWAIMAAPLCFGYIMARTDNPDAALSPLISVRARLTRLADGRMVWLAVAAAVMTTALLLSMSRSGILSLAAATTFSILVLGGRTRRGRHWWVLAVFAVAAGIVLWRLDVPALAERFAQTGSGIESRLRIWADTMPIVRDFWLTGTGVGSYPTAMVYYQRADRVVQFNQAHNHYLQAAAEGGLVLLGLALSAIGALAMAIREQLSRDRSSAYWIRAGAVCGLAAVALQSLWETGLVMPANAALAAVLGAIATYERHGE